MSKGSRRRPTTVPLEQSDANFESIFGKRVPTYLKNRTIEPNTEAPVDFPKEDNTKDNE
jgi:hypothetical protein